jgi:hypothetical protein
MYPEIALPIICHGDVMRYVGLLPVGTTFELVNDNWKQP